MRASERRVARAWIRGKLRLARDLDKTRKETGDDPDRTADYQVFLDERYQGGHAQVTNPNPDSRKSWPEVSFQTAMRDDGFREHVSREFEQWRAQSEDKPSERGPSRDDNQPEEDREEVSPEDAQPAADEDIYDNDDAIADILSRIKTPQKVVKDVWRTLADQDKVLEVGKKGEVVDKAPLSVKSANKTEKRKLRHEDHEGDFLWKPSEGNEVLRYGINPDTYHEREAAAYDVDRLFGDGTVVPPTFADDSGSYQAWADGAEMLVNAGMGLDSVTDDELKSNESFQRMLLLDAVLAHEDRRGPNAMVRWVGPKTDASNLRFDAIDNGCALADPEGKHSSAFYSVHDPWAYTVADEADEERVEGRKKAVTEVYSDIPEKLHKSLQNVDLKDFVTAVAKPRVGRRAVRAASVRMVALQENPKVLGELIRQAGGDHVKGLQMFYHLSGKNPKKLLKLAGAEHRLADIEDAVKDVEEVSYKDPLSEERTDPGRSKTEPQSPRPTPPEAKDEDKTRRSKPPDEPTRRSKPPDEPTRRSKPPDEGRLKTERLAMVGRLREAYLRSRVRQRSLSFDCRPAQQHP